MSSIYVFSGLGADQRIFRNIDFGDNEIVFVDWQQPLRGESIEEYALRISKKIIREHPIILGLSFGGMIAIEVSKYVKPIKTIIISSAKTKYEIPFYYRLLGKLGIHKLLPSRYIKGTSSIAGWLFGTKNHAENQLLKAILKETDPTFLKWAIDQIVRWKNTSILDNLIHIHGTKDIILPLKYVSADHIIEGGTHLMVLNRSEKVSKLLQRLI